MCLHDEIGNNLDEKDYQKPKNIIFSFEYDKKSGKDQLIKF